MQLTEEYLLQQVKNIKVLADKMRTQADEAQGALKAYMNIYNAFKAEASKEEDLKDAEQHQL